MTLKARAIDVNKEFGRLIDYVGARLDALEPGAAELKRGSSSEQDLEVVMRLEALLKTVKPVLQKQARRSRKAKAELTSMAASLRHDLMGPGVP